MSDLMFQKESRPASQRATGASARNWVDELFPTLSESPGEDFLLFVYPEDQKQAGVARSANIRNYLWANAPTEEFSVTCRTRPDKTHGVYAMYVGKMSKARRAELEAARLARTPISRRPAAGTPASAPTAAERAKAAATAQ